jgi:hypothetical protein
MFHEFSVSTFEMIFEMEVGENVRKLMMEEERKGHLMTEDEMRSQMNATPEPFVRYMMTHNL